eukprot:Hpha_TRINITY_DN13828_c0_g1::TRINITY_DN13828_c0_g1_i1::g.69909::m.69909
MSRLALAGSIACFKLIGPLHKLKMAASPSWGTSKIPGAFRIPPKMPVSGTPISPQRVATPCGTFPDPVCSSIRPSPVIAKEAPLSWSFSPERSATRSKPDCRLAPKNAIAPPPKPPAAPAPARVGSSAGTPGSPVQSRPRLRSPSSNTARFSGVSAPFWGPYTAVAPRSPHSGLVTSQATITSVDLRRGSARDVSMRAMSRSRPPTGGTSRPDLSKNRNPRAWAAPVPPSFVALPPMHKTIRRAPALRASSISSPVPVVLVSKASRSEGSSRASPDAFAISITAVVTLPSAIRPYVAATGFPRGPLTSTVLNLPPRCSTNTSNVLSPPSASGTTAHSAVGAALSTPSLIASLASLAVRHSLKALEHNTTFIFTCALPLPLGAKKVQK